MTIGLDTLGGVDLPVVPGQARSFTFTKAGGYTGTWTAVGGSTLTKDLTVAATSGTVRTVTVPADNDRFIDQPWRLRRDGVDKAGGVIRVMRTGEDPGDGTFTFTDADGVTVTVDVFGSDLGSTFVYNSSGTQSGNTYTSWSDLITAVGAVAGPKVIQFVQNETLPTGAWNLNGATLAGIGGNTTTALRVTFPTGCTITNPGMVMATDGLTLYSTSSAAVLTVSSARTMIFENDTLVCSKSAAFFTVSATSGLVLFSIRNGAGIAKPSDLSIAGGDYESINVTGAGVTVQIVDACGYSNLQNDVVRGGAGAGTTITRYIFSSVDLGASGPGDTQTNASNWSVTLGLPAYRVAFDGDGSGESVFTGAETVDDALVALAGAGGGSGPDLSDATPAALGVAAAGVAATASRSDHVHTLPTIPALSDSTPAALGTASAGVAATSSRSDHVHAQSLRRGSIMLPYAAATTYSGMAIAAVTNNYWGSSAQNDYMEWTWQHIDAGTYTIATWGQVGSDRGITTVAVDGVSAGTMDWYAGGASISRLTIAGVTVTDGTHTIRLTTSSKHASSSGYVTRLIEALTFIRTA